MTDAFPYFQSGHILSAKGHFLHKQPNAKQKVSTAVLYVTSPKWLKHVLLSTPQGVSVSPKAAPAPRARRSFPEPKASYDYEAGLMSESERELLIREVYQRLDDLKVAKRLYHQRSSELEARYGSDTNEPSSEDTSSEAQADADDEDDPSSSSLDTSANEPHTDSKGASPDASTDESDAEHTTPPSDTPEALADTDALTSMPERPIGFTVTTDKAHGESDKAEVKDNSASRDEEQQQQQHTIQNFLDKLPRLDAVKPPDEIVLPEGDEPSVADLPENLYSEALAKACEAQKKYARAIQIYTALKAREPERADFFIQKIQSLEKKRHAE